MWSLSQALPQRLQRGDWPASPQRIRPRSSPSANAADPRRSCPPTRSHHPQPTPLSHRGVVYRRRHWATWGIVYSRRRNATEDPSAATANKVLLDAIAANASYQLRRSRDDSGVLQWVCMYVCACVEFFSFHVNSFFFSAAPLTSEETGLQRFDLRVPILFCFVIFITWTSHKGQKLGQTADDKLSVWYSLWDTILGLLLSIFYLPYIFTHLYILVAFTVVNKYWCLFEKCLV